MLKIIITVLFLASPCFALSPAEQWVMNSWLAVDGSGDLNNDGICDNNDLILAAQHDVTKIVKWGRTEGVLKDALQVAIDEANYEQKPRLASLYRRQLIKILTDEGYYSNEITGPTRTATQKKK